MKHPLYVIAYYWRKYVSGPFHQGINDADMERCVGNVSDGIRYTVNF